MNRYLGIDPGNTESGWCVVRASVSPSGSPVITVDSADKCINGVLRSMLYEWAMPQPDGAIAGVVIENMQSFGGTVGRTTLDTCIEIGRIVQVCHDNQLPVVLIPRPEYARWMADGARKVNDSVLRQALLLRYGGDKKGEPLHMLKGASDKRSAFAVAAYAIETGRVI